jgi:Protein of unknown function (DUF3376)/Patatin-like phospholipase
MFLAATVFGGIRVSRLVDPRFSDRRREAFFHFRHLAASSAFTDLAADDAIEQVGTAARASASFPAAFEPVEVGTDDFRGRIHLPETPESPATVRLLDGGIVDNIPVARAIRATASAPASDPVRRWVAFLHPNPEGLVPRTISPRRQKIPGIPSVLKDFAASLSGETLLDDLEVLEEHNREAESIKLQRVSLFRAALRDRTSDPDAALATVDAYRIYAVINDPVPNLTWLPIAQAPPRSSIAGWSQDDRYRLRMRILDAVVEEMRSGRGTLRAFARVARLALFTIDWIRWAESQGRSGFAGQRRITYDLLLVAQLVDSALARSILGSTADPVAVLSETLDRVERSGALHSLIRCVGQRSGTVDDHDVALSDHLRAGSPQEVAMRNLARGVLPEDPTDRGRRASEHMLGLLAEVGAGICRSTERLKAEDPSAYSVLTEEIRRSNRGHLGMRIACGRRKRLRDDVRSAILSVDAAEAELHRGTTRGAPQTLEYVRISGAAESPLARPSADGDALPSFASIAPGPDGEIDPDRKLAGNKLGSFSAFLSPRFRANDWMWGRMDAATEIVKLLYRPDYLARIPAVDLEERVRDVVMHPFDREDLSVEAAGIVKDAETICADLWRENRSEITGELLAARKAPREADRLFVTRRTIQARWHLELAIREIPRVIAQPLDVSDHPAGWPLEPIGQPWEAKTPKERIQHLLDRYEATPTKVGDLWGRRHTTGLGVRAVRATARALIPSRGPRALLRIGVGVPMLIAVAAVLSRGAFLIAWNALLNVVLIPRMDGLFSVLVALLSLCASIWFWLKFVRRKAPHRRRSTWTAIVTGVLVVIGMASIIDKWWVPDDTWLLADDPLRAQYPWAEWPFTIDLVLPVAAVAVASAAAVVCLWIWARTWAIVLASVATGLLMGWWVILGAWSAPQGSRFANDLAWTRSMWIPALMLVFAFTWIALHFRVEARPPRQDLG